MTTLCLVTIAGCMFSTKREVMYSRATKQKAETQGFMHLAQDKVFVVVQGDSTIREFTVPKPERVEVGAAGYALILDDDLGKLIENTQVLIELGKDPAVLAKIREVQARVQAANAAQK